MVSHSPHSIQRSPYLRAAIVGLLVFAGYAGATAFRASASQNFFPVTIVSAASYGREYVAPESIASAFGENLATTTMTGTDTDPNTPGIQLPTTLGGTSVLIGGTPAPLLFVSPGQVNFIVPGEIKEAVFMPVSIRSGDNSVTYGSVHIVPSAPGLFTYNGLGNGIPAGILTRVKLNGEQSLESLFQIDSLTGVLRTRPIDLGPAGERVFLILFATGVRYADDPNQDGNVAESVGVAFNGYETVPSYAGPQPDLPGLDQINVEIPRSLLGVPELTIEVTTSSSMIEESGAEGEKQITRNSNLTETSLVVPAIRSVAWRSIGLPDKEVTSLALTDSFLSAGTANGIFRTENNGQTWEESQFTPNLLQYKINSMRVRESGQVMAATDRYGVFLSSQNGKTWVSDSSLNDQTFINQRVLSLTAVEDLVFAGTDGKGIFCKGKFADKTYSAWHPVNEGLRNLRISALVSDNSRVFAGTAGDGIFIFNDFEMKWYSINQGLPASAEVTSIAIHENILLAGTNHGLYHSRDGGGNWSPVNPGLSPQTTVSAMVSYADKFFAATTGGGVYVSNDQGVSWEAINSGLTALKVLSLFAHENVLYAGTSAGVFTTNIVPVVNHPPQAMSLSVTLDEDQSASIALQSSDPDNDKLDYLLRDLPRYGQLSGTPPNLVYIPNPDYFGEDQFSIRVSDGKISSRLAHVTITVTPVNDPLTMEIVGKTDVLMGESVWLNLKIQDPDRMELDITVENMPQEAKLRVSGREKLFHWIPQSAGNFDLLFKATDGVDTVRKPMTIRVAENPEKGRWSYLPLPPGAQMLYKVASDGTHLYAVTDAGFFRSTDNAATWQTVNLPAGELFVSSLYRDGRDLYLDTAFRLYHSSDEGMNWLELKLPENERSVNAFNANGDTLLLATIDELYLSTDKGTTWKRITQNIPLIFDSEFGFYTAKIVRKGTEVFLALVGNGVFHSRDGGNTWAILNRGFPNPEELVPAHFFAGGDDLFLLSNTDLYRASLQEREWNQINQLPMAFSSLDYFEFGVPYTLMDAGSGMIAYAAAGRGVYLSRNQGSIFLPANLGLPDPQILSMAIVGSKIFIMTGEGFASFGTQ